jgi:hypothetical protein
VSTTTEPSTSCQTEEPAQEPSRTTKPRSVGRLALIGFVAVAVAFVSGIAAANFVETESAAPDVVASAASAGPQSALPAIPEFGPVAFLAAWHANPDVRSYGQPDWAWLIMGRGTCQMIGMVGMTRTDVIIVRAGNPNILTVAEAEAFTDLANAKLCPGNRYAPGLRIDVPTLDFPTPSPRGHSPSIPSLSVDRPDMEAPSVPRLSTGTGGSESEQRHERPESSGSGSSEPSLRPAPDRVDGGTLEPLH